MAVVDNIAQSPLPQDAAEKYPGKWVAIRDGEVIAAGDSLEELENDGRVEPTDTLYRVPVPGSLFY